MERIRSSFDNPRPNLEDASPVVPEQEQSNLDEPYAEEKIAINQIFNKLVASWEQANREDVITLVRILQQKIIILTFKVPDPSRAHMHFCNALQELSSLSREYDHSSMADAENLLIAAYSSISSAFDSLRQDSVAKLNTEDPID